MKKLPRDTMIGELARYVSDQSVVDYQPMCASFSLFQEQNADTICEKSIQLLTEYIEQPIS